MNIYLPIGGGKYLTLVLLQTAPRERRKLEYQESLKERYQHLREINRISKYVPALAVRFRAGWTHRYPTVSSIPF